MPATGRLGTSALCLLVLAGAVPSAAVAQAQGLTADGTEFVLTLEGTRVLRSADLVGATLMVDAGTKQLAVIIESIEEDPTSVGGRVLLHHFVIRNEDGTRSEFCTPDGAGETLGFPVPDDNGGFELTCTSGAIGKCVRWGYRFWEEKAGGPPLRALHRACIHMTRADYGGDGSTFTRDGTTIFMCDRFGVHPCRENAPLQFEAAWGVDGAVCVVRPRIAEITTIEALAEKYPRLASHLGPDACREDNAIRDPAALLFNRSEE